MNINELQSLDEALDYLNEGKIIDTIKSLFDKYKKKKAEKKKKNDHHNRYDYIVLDTPIVSEARKNFRDKLVSECKSIVSKYKDFAACDSEYDEYYEDFYTIDLYLKGKKPEFSNSEITVIESCWYYLDAYDKYPHNMTKSEFDETPEVQKWYEDQQKVFEEAKKRLSKYGTVDVDGSYDVFMVDIKLNKNTIASFKDDEVISNAMNS